MAKRKGKRRPADMLSVKQTSDGSGSPEKYLIPGTPERERMLEQQEARQEELELEQQIQRKEDDQAQEERQVETAYGGAEQGIRNYRNFMRKYEQVSDTRDIIEEGLGRSVSRKDLNDELYDPAVTASNFKKEAVADHAAEFARKREMPEFDTNGDGKIDEEDDTIMTPGMKRMARFL